MLYLNQNTQQCDKYLSGGGGETDKIILSVNLTFIIISL